MDVNTANILPLIWASKFNLGLPNLSEPVASNIAPPVSSSSSMNMCSTNLTRANMSNMSNGTSNLWPAAAAAALSNDITTSFKQLLANAAAAAVNVNGIGHTFAGQSADPNEHSTYTGSGHVTATANGFNSNNGNMMNSNSNGSSGSSSNGPLSPNNGAMNGLNLQQALMARLGQAAAVSILGDSKQNQLQQSSGNYSAMHSNQLPNSKLMHLMPSYCNASSPGRLQIVYLLLTLLLYW